MTIFKLRYKEGGSFYNAIYGSREQAERDSSRLGRRFEVIEFECYEKLAEDSIIVKKSSGPTECLMNREVLPIPARGPDTELIDPNKMIFEEKSAELAEIVVAVDDQLELDLEKQAEELAEAEEQTVTERQTKEFLRFPNKDAESL